MIKSRQLAKALYKLAEEKTPALENKFFDFLEKGKLKAQLPSILYHLEKITETEREKKGIVIEVAHEIKPKLAQEVKKYLEANRLPETVKIKKELIAGFRAKWQGRIYDASFQTGLKKLAETIGSF
jgi:F0F1-type ATP synthase delta subunit